MHNHRTCRGQLSRTRPAASPLERSVMSVSHGRLGVRDELARRGGPGRHSRLCPVSAACVAVPGRQRPGTGRARRAPAGDQEVQQPVVIPGQLGNGSVSRGEVVEVGLCVHVQPSFRRPKLGSVRERGVTARAYRQARQGNTRRNRYRLWPPRLPLAGAAWQARHAAPQLCPRPAVGPAVVPAAGSKGRPHKSRPGAQAAGPQGPVRLAAFQPPTAPAARSHVAAAPAG